MKKIKIKNKEIFHKLAAIQNIVYLNQNWIEISQTYIQATDSDLTNKLQLIMDIIEKQNNIIFNDIENFWSNLYDSL